MKQRRTGISELAWQRFMSSQDQFDPLADYREKPAPLLLEPHERDC
jgi:hypothetical protein